MSELSTAPPTRRALSIGVSSAGDPTNAGHSSGTPASLLRALEATVGRAVPLSTSPNPPAERFAVLTGALAAVRPADLLAPQLARRRLLAAGAAGAPMRWAAGRALRARVAATQPLDGLIQYGGEHLAIPATPMVTYQDSTLVQALRSYPWAHLRGMNPRDVERSIRRQRAVYESVIACCTMSHWAAASVRGDYGIDAGKVHVVGLGPNYEPSPNPARDWSSPRFLFVGVDWERKNGAAVVRAFASLRQRIPAATLDLVGGHPRVDAEGVTGHGRLFLTDRSDRARMHELYRRATVFVMPSLHEPSGIVHVESSAAGIPSIGSVNGGAASCIGDGGRLVDPLDDGALLAAMNELADPETARALGARAEERSALFTWTKVAERLVRALGPAHAQTADLAAFL